VGTTFTGQMDPVKEINDLLLEIKEKKGWDIPIHADGASGGFIVPFLYPDLMWDFRLEQVRSINVSGHKYGLVYPGVGWVIFKDRTDIPPDLIFNINYLGGNMSNYSLNFSKASNTIIAQYYNIIRLGFNGYKDIMDNMIENTRYMVGKLEETGKFEVINQGLLFPLVTVRLKDVNFTVFQLSDKLREKGWIVPAYTLPANADDIAVLRMVVKENFGRDMVESFLDDITTACKGLESENNKDLRENPTLLY